MTRSPLHHGGISGIGSRKPRLTRQWDLAREKCDNQGCRITGEPAEAAHIIGRKHDFEPPINWDDRVNSIGAAWGQRKLLVWPNRICPLRPDLHRRYDNGDLDLLPYLTDDEQAQAVKDAGGVYPMLWRVSPPTNPKRLAA